ncbi:hypothetical protein C8R46DRAFT_250836 [Mycena filopes]|nr:hypothetical protein C8R46DRAFT_250836 [Mycena filopes]
MAMRFMGIATSDSRRAIRILAWTNTGSYCWRRDFVIYAQRAILISGADLRFQTKFLDSSCSLREDSSWIRRAAHRRRYASFQTNFWAPFVLFARTLHGFVNVVIGVATLPFDANFWALLVLFARALLDLLNGLITQVSAMPM